MSLFADYIKKNNIKIDQDKYKDKDKYADNESDDADVSLLLPQYGDEMQLNCWEMNLINNFIYSTTQIWKFMYEQHIIPIKNMFNIDLLNDNTKLTSYVDYVKRIKDSQIRLPDWFLLSNGTKQQKIIPSYDPDIDFLPISLIDSYSSIRGKTLMMYHKSDMMQRNGMNVSDIITRNICKIFANPLSLTYIRRYSTSPEEVFFIKDHFMAYYQHLLYALLEPNLCRMFLISSHQIYMIIKILKDMKSELVNELILLNIKRGNVVQDILFNERYFDMSRIFEKLWPNLELICLMKQGGMQVHTNYIRKYIGNIKTYCPVYYIPETTIGYDILNESAFIINPMRGYFEFIDIINNKVKNIRKLEIGNLYNIVVSTRSCDFYRYVTGEIVRVLGYYNGSPKIEIICRDTDLLKIDSVIISPDMIEKVLMKDFNLVDYGYRYHDDKIKIYVEIDIDDYMVKCGKASDVKKTIKQINIMAHLKNKLNIDTELRIVMPDTFDSLYKNRYSDEIDPGLIQIPRLIVDDMDINILKENIIYQF
jgi:hypothetical protein